MVMPLMGVGMAAPHLSLSTSTSTSTRRSEQWGLTAHLALLLSVTALMMGSVRGERRPLTQARARARARARAAAAATNAPAQCSAATPRNAASC